MSIHPNTRGGWSIDGIGNYPTAEDAARIDRINRRIDDQLAHGVHVDGGPPRWLAPIGLGLTCASLGALAVLILTS